MLRRWWLWFLARFRLSEAAVCEMSAGLPPDADFHARADGELDVPYHFAPRRCRRCGKVFTV